MDDDVLSLMVQISTKSCQKLAENKYRGNWKTWKRRNGNRKGNCLLFCCFVFMLGELVFYHSVSMPRFFGM